LYRQILNELQELKIQHDNVVKRRTLSKLNRLYRGKVCLQEESDNYVNLSRHILTEHQIFFFNLGIKFPIRSKFDKNRKKIELEILYECILNLTLFGLG
jgi:hypothetical protein